MEKSKKSKKKLIGIIAGCAMAFVLTVVVSVAVTLAYFGDTTSADTTITMGQALKFDTSKTASVENAMTVSGGSVLPGATGKVTVTGTIAESTTKAYFRIKLNIAAIDTGSSLSTNDFNFSGYTVTVGGAEGTLSTETDGYYYLISSGTTLAEINPAAAATDVVVSMPYTIDNSLKNEVAGKSIKITATMEIIQSEYVGSTISEVATEWTTANVG